MQCIWCWALFCIQKQWRCGVVDDKYLSACQTTSYPCLLCWWLFFGSIPNDGNLLMHQRRANFCTHQKQNKCHRRNKDSLRYENALSATKPKTNEKEPTEIIKRNKLEITQPKWRENKAKCSRKKDLHWCLHLAKERRAHEPKKQIKWYKMHKQQASKWRHRFNDTPSECILAKSKMQ